MFIIIIIIIMFENVYEIPNNVYIHVSIIRGHLYQV